MPSTTSQGLATWATSIRSNLANNPSRQLFEDQIQSSGFLFLDDYFDNVLSGPKKENILDLVKTPGRKKDTGSKKSARTGGPSSSKLRNVISVSSDHIQEKENDPPVSSRLRTAVARHSKEDIQNSIEASSSALQQTASIHHHLSHEKENQTVKPEVTIAVSDADIDVFEQNSVDVSNKDSLLSPPPDQHSLSVIAEDEEPAERSKASVSPPKVEPSPPPKSSRALKKASTSDSLPRASQETRLNNTASFHSALTDHDSLLGTTSPSQSTNPSELARSSAASSSESSRKSSRPKSSKSSVLSATDASEPEDTHPPSVQSTRSSRHSKTKNSKASADNEPAEHVPPPRAPSPYIEYTEPIRDEDAEPRSILAHKKSMSSFTPLPMPSPFRKSGRVPFHRESSVDVTTTLPSASAHTPAAAAPSLGKRTSWLQKARAVKALDDMKRVSSLTGESSASLAPGPRPSSVARALSTTPHAGTAKRKSSQMLDSHRHGNGGHHASDSEHRPVKAAKVDQNGNNRTSAHSLKEAPTAEPEPKRAPSPEPEPVAPSSSKVPLSPDLEQHDNSVLDQLTKIVGKIGTRNETNKTLDGATAHALAQARAEAEARIAERNKLNNVSLSSEGNASTKGDSTVSPAAPAEQADLEPEPERPSSSSHRSSSRNSKQASARLSLSDLVTHKEEEWRNSDKASRKKISQSAEKRQQHQQQSALELAESISTTPPDSPPPVIVSRPASIATVAAPLLPNAGPVFNKPKQVFAPPPAAKPIEASTTTKKTPFSSGSVFSHPTGAKKAPLSAQSTFGSTRSESIFDKNENSNAPPSWMRSQDTGATSPYASKLLMQHIDDVDIADNDDDDDDSWPLEEKLSAGQGGWGSNKEDTWSTIPSDRTGSYKGDSNHTGSSTRDLLADEERAAHKGSHQAKTKANTSNGVSRHENDGEDEDVDMEMDVEEPAGKGYGHGKPVPAPIEDLHYDEEELEELDIVPDKPTITLVSNVPRSQSQMSMVSTDSSQSGGGLFGQATKWAGSFLGSSKKAKVEPNKNVKSLALAAAAAERQKEEEKKKTARMEEMAKRRDAAIQRKTEEERARKAEEERKTKEEMEKRKRDREEHTDKRPLVKGVKKEDDGIKKRKIGYEFEKKAELKKQPTFEKLQQSTRTVPTVLKLAKALPSSRSATPVGSNHHAMTSSTTTTSAPKVFAASVDNKPFRPAPALPSSSNLHGTTPQSNGSVLKGKAKAKALPPDDPDAQPATVMQSQMAARAKAQMQAAGSSTNAAAAAAAAKKKKEIAMASEAIELPDINSEYSDSEDEDRVRTFDAPDWAQSPQLRAQLQEQLRQNPDDIFGPVPELRMEEIFRTRSSRFRARTSSANWAGTDRLTVEEEREYAKRMGYK